MRRAVTILICVARRFTSSYVARLNGPIAPGRWQVVQRRHTIGAISLKLTRASTVSAAAATSAIIILG